MPLVTVQMYNNTRLIMFNKQQYYLVKLMMAQRLTHIRAGSRGQRAPSLVDTEHPAVNT